LLQLIHDFEVEWKTINEIWLVEQEKKDRRKKSRFEKSVEEEEDDEECEFVIDKFENDEDDFISFEDDENEDENVPHAENAEHARHDNLRTNHSIDDEFNSEDFFDRMNDERDFQALYS
jgi:hypothetical protein